MKSTDKKDLVDIDTEDLSARRDDYADPAIEKIRGLTGDTGYAAKQIISVERNPDIAATARLLEEIQNALGGRDPKLVEELLDLTADTYVLAQPLLGENREGGADGLDDTDTETQTAIATVADNFLATLQEKLPPDKGQKLQKGRGDLTALLRNLRRHPGDDSKSKYKKGPRRGSATSLRRMLTLAGVLGLAACNSSPPPSPPPSPPVSTSTSDLERAIHGGPKIFPDGPPSTTDQVSEWVEGTWKKVTGGKGAPNSPGASSKPFKLPTIPTALALLWALALATDKFKWDDRILIGGSTLALLANICGDALLNFSNSVGVNLNPLKPILGHTWWWAIEDAWLIASLSYLKDGPLKNRKALHYILGAGIWVALGYLNR